MHTWSYIFVCVELILVYAHKNKYIVETVYALSILGIVDVSLMMIVYYAIWMVLVNGPCCVQWRNIGHQISSVLLYEAFVASGAASPNWLAVFATWTCAHGVERSCPSYAGKLSGFTPWVRHRKLTTTRKILGHSLGVSAAID